MFTYLYLIYTVPTICCFLIISSLMHHIYVPYTYYDKGRIGCYENCGFMMCYFLSLKIRYNVFPWSQYPNEKKTVLHSCRECNIVPFFRYRYSMLETSIYRFEFHRHIIIVLITFIEESWLAIAENETKLIQHTQNDSKTLMLSLIL